MKRLFHAIVFVLSGAQTVGDTTTLADYSALAILREDEE
jgi:hypothetical protein